MMKRSWTVATLLVFGLGALGCPAEKASEPVEMEKVTAHPEFYAEGMDLPGDAEGGVACVRTGEPAGPTGPGPDGALRLHLGSPAALQEPFEKGRYLNFHPGSGPDEKYEQRWWAEPAELPEKPGTYEATVHPCRDATDAEVVAARELWEASRRAAAKNGWFDLEKAKADGFHLGHPDEEVHYVNDEFVGDEHVLDPERPEFLVFYEYDGVPLLAGYMYMMPGLADRGPQTAGPLTLWHYHVMGEFCYRDGLVLGPPTAPGECAEGTPTRRTPEMLHVWFFDRDDGAFASSMVPATSARTEEMVRKLKPLEEHHHH